MLYSQDRNQLRQVFFAVWEKKLAGQPLDNMESIIANIISLHPQYHAYLKAKEQNIDKDFSVEAGETNPFLHMSMHIAIAEQLSINQPMGIQDLYQQLKQKLNDPHEVEHVMMECLGEMIWKAQRYQQAPDEKVYLSCIKNHL